MIFPASHLGCQRNLRLLFDHSHVCKAPRGDGLELGSSGTKPGLVTDGEGGNMEKGPKANPPYLWLFSSADFEAG